MSGKSAQGNDAPGGPDGRDALRRHTVCAMTGRIDPETGELLGVDGSQPRTLAALRQINPPCPRCDTATAVRPIPTGRHSSTGAELYVFQQHVFHCRCYDRSHI